MCVCVYIYIYTHVFPHLFVYSFIYLFTHIHVQREREIYIYMYTHFPHMSYRHYFQSTQQGRLREQSILPIKNPTSILKIFLPSLMLIVAYSLVVEVGKLEHDLPPTPDQGEKNKQNKQSGTYI